MRRKRTWAASRKAANRLQRDPPGLRTVQTPVPGLRRRQKPPALTVRKERRVMKDMRESGQTPRNPPKVQLVPGQAFP